MEAHHHQLSSNPKPGENKDKPVWAKCDMLYTLSTDRLELFRIRTRKGRETVNAHVTDADFEAIRECVRAALSLRQVQPQPNIQPQPEAADA
jgi:uncharacterized protein YifN (PemK superfamily)